MSLGSQQSLNMRHGKTPEALKLSAGNRGSKTYMILLKDFEIEHHELESRRWTDAHSSTAIRWLSWWGGLQTKSLEDHEGLFGHVMP